MLKILKNRGLTIHVRVQMTDALEIPMDNNTENEIFLLDPVYIESTQHTSYSPKTEGGGYIHPALDILLF